MLRKITLITIVFNLLFSCSRYSKEQMLYDYVKKTSFEKLNVNIDHLDFNILLLMKISNITAKDSLILMQKYFDIKKKEKIDYFTQQLELYKNLNMGYAYTIKNTKNQSINDMHQDFTDNIEENIKRIQNCINLYNGDCKGTFLEPVLSKIKRYKMNPDKVLSSKYEANYTLTDPTLNATETFNYYYYTNLHNTSFIKDEKVEKILE